MRNTKLLNIYTSGKKKDVDHFMESNLKIGDKKAIGKYVYYAQLQSMDDFYKLSLWWVI